MFQNSLIPETSSCLLLGLIPRLIYSLSSCQRFSIGFRSGDSGGVFHQFTPSLAGEGIIIATEISLAHTHPMHSPSTIEGMLRPWMSVVHCLTLRKFNI